MPEVQMRRNINRRLDRIELAIPIPITAQRFIARVRQRIQRTGEGLEAALATLVRDLRGDELASLGAEIDQVVFGSNVAASSAARQALVNSDAVQLGFSQ
jgi:hypothetical protein